MTTYTIYHNPKCSKSRQALEILNNANVTVDVIEYLKSPPTQQQMTEILALLKLSPKQIMRQKEAEYKEAGLDNPKLGEAEQIQQMIAHPKVIERPIVVKTESCDGITTITQAAIGRPPENINAILNND